jgi:hypothetical protein
MEAIRSSETSGTTLRTTRRYIPEDDTLQNHRCENLKSYMYRICLELNDKGEKHISTDFDTVRKCSSSSSQV